MSQGRGILGFENREKIIAGIITLVSGAPSCTAKGIASVAKAATGKITVTLDRPFNRVLSAHAQVVINADAVAATIADAVQVDARDATSGGTVTIYTAATAGGAAADLADTRAISLEMIVSDSDV